MALDLINKDSFVGFYNIQFSTVGDDFSTYAQQVEELILIEAFGAEMAADMEANPTEQKYIDLINDYNISQMLERFFFFYYLRDRESYSTTLGEFSADAENASRDTKHRNQKITTVYNQAIAQYEAAIEFVSGNKDIYTLYSESVPKPIENAFGVIIGSTSTTDLTGLFLTGFCRNTIYQWRT